MMAACLLLGGNLRGAGITSEEDKYYAAIGGFLSSSLALISAHGCPFFFFACSLLFVTNIKPPRVQLLFFSFFVIRRIFRPVLLAFDIICHGWYSLRGDFCGPAFRTSWQLGVCHAMSKKGQHQGLLFECLNLLSGPRVSQKQLLACHTNQRNLSGLAQ